MSATDHFYLEQNEPLKGCLLALKEIIMQQDKNITHELKYGMPFFCYKGKMFCYIWVHKKHGQPYIGIVEGKHFDEPFLIQEKRARMKIMLLDAGEDLPVKKIKAVIGKAVSLYKTGIIPV
jgi:hypothetical protein